MTKETLGPDEAILPKEYEFTQKLESGATLKAWITEPRDVCLDFSYKYVQEGARRARPKVINDTKLRVEYTDGWLTNCSLCMEVIISERLEKKHFAGVDISPDAKTYIEFIYELKMGALCLKTIQVGAQPIIELAEPTDGKVVIQKFVPPQFPVWTTIHPGTDFVGDCRIPFLHDNGKMHFFEFLTNITRRYSI